MNLEGFESVMRWLTKVRKRTASENTRRAYLRWLDAYCTYVGMDPDQLIFTRRVDLKSEDMSIRMRHEELLDKWVFLHLEGEKGYSRNTCALAYNVVRSFYDHNYVRLSVKAPETWVEKQIRRLKREELKALIDALKSPMHRAYVLCQAQSGLSISDLLKITYGDVKEQLDGGATHIHLENRREKTKGSGYHDTFFGQEAVAALREYLNNRDGVTDSDRLFPCSSKNVNMFLKRAARRARIGHVSSHDLRKFFDSHMKLGIEDAVLVDWWMGHNLDKIKRTYSIPPWERQLEEYRKGEREISLKK